MKLEEWGNVIVSWANFLDTNEKINSVDDLSNSQLFAHLLKVLGQNYEDTADNNALYKFLTDEYPSLDLGVINSKSKEDTILRATALLIYCSIHHEENVVQKKMTDLPGWMQLYLTEFLKEFVDVSKCSISRDLVFSEISKILTPAIDGDDDGKGTPKFGTPLTYSTSPSTGELSQKGSSKKASKVKKLRNEIETLTIIESELRDELESAKEHIRELEGTIQKKDLEISHLKSEMLKLEDNNSTYEVHSPTIDVESNKIDKLNLKIDNLEQENAKLKRDLLLGEEDRELKNEEIQNLKNSVKKAKLLKSVYDNDCAEYQKQINELQKEISELIAANKEQSDYIAELLQPKDDSKRFSDSHGDSLILPESLGQQVIDVEIQELKEILSSKDMEIKDYIQGIENLKLELKNIENKHSTALEEFIQKEKEFVSKERVYLADLESKESTMKSNLEEMRNLECQNIFLSNTIREKDSIVVSMQSSIDLLNEEVHILRNKEKSILREIQSKDAYNQQLLNEIDALTVVINENSTEKDLLMKSVTEKDNAIQQCFMNLNEVQIECERQLKNLHNELESSREEVSLLTNEKMELTSEIEYYREQISLYETKLKEREEEILDNINIIGKLESDIENFKVIENEMKLAINDSELKNKELIEKLDLKECILSESNNIISSLNLEKNNLFTSLKELEDQLHLKLKLISSLESQVNNQEEQLKMQEDIKAKKVFEFNCIIDDLKSSVTTLTSSKNDLAIEIEALNFKLKEKSSLICSYEAQIDNLEIKVSELNEMNQTLVEQISSKDIVLSDFTNEISELKCEIGKQNAKCLTLSQQLDVYMNKYENEVRKNENLLIENNDKKERISKFLIDMGELEKSCNNLKNLLDETERENLRHKNTCKALESEISELKIVIAGWVTQNSNIEDILKEKESTIETLQITLKSLKKEAEERQITLDSLKKDIDVEKNENRKLMSLASEKERELSELKIIMKTSEDLNIHKINMLNNELDSFRLLKETFDNESEIFKKEIKDALYERESIISKLTAIEVEHSGCGDKILNSESLIIELKNKISVLEEKLNSSAEKGHNLEVLLDEKCDSITTLQEEINKKDLYIQQLESSLSDLEKTKDKNELELKSQLENFKRELELENLECQKLSCSINEKNKEIQELLSQISLSENENKIEKNSLNMQLNNLKSLNESLENKNELLKSELDKVTDNLKATEIELSSSAQKIHNSELASHILREKISMLEESLSKLNDYEQSSKTELQNKCSEIMMLKEELKTLQKTLSDREFDEGILSTRLQAKEAEVNKMKLEIVEITKQFKINEEKAQEEINIHIKKIHDLDSTIGKLNNQFIKVNREKETIFRELEEKDKSLQDLMPLRSELSRLKSEKKCLEKEVIVRSNEVNQVQKELVTYQVKLSSAENENELLQSKLLKSANEIQELTEQIQVLKYEIDEYQKSKGELTDQIAEKNKIIADLERKITLNGNITEEISGMSAAISSKDELIKKYMEEKNLALLDLDLHLKKEDLMKSQLMAKDKEIEEMRNRLIQVETESSKSKVSCSEQDQIIKSLYATLQSQNSEIKEKDAIITRLEKEIKTLNQSVIEKDNKIAEAVIPKNEKNVHLLKSEERLYSERDLEMKIQELKTSYEKKVDSYKATVKKRFAEKLEDLTSTLQNENTELKEKFLQEQERCNKLQSELWNASDKLLLQQEQHRKLLAKHQMRNAFEVVRPGEALSPISKARSMEVLSGRNRGIDNFARDISFNESSSSVSIRSLPRGMGKKFSFSTGKVFPTMDEDGEVFDNRYLADLKAGICNVPTEEDRMSTLQYRNSLCPPHLKSSYPAETQFFSNLREDEIKSGPIQSANSEKDNRKTKVRGSEKVCPPTPKSSKSSTSGKEGVVNESFVLRETNHRKSDLPVPHPTKVATPGRLRALFTSSRKDENSPRRKSMFLRKN